MTSPPNDEILPYLEELQVYEQLTPHLICVSDSSGHIKTGTLGIEGTKIYTRLVLGAMTIGSILPRNRITHSELWDFPSVAVLTRSLIESAHRYLYLIEPGITQDEAEFRRMLHFYRINYEKYRLYSEEEGHPILKEFEQNLPKAKAEIVASSVYKTLDKNLAKRIRTGKADMHLTETEVSKRNGLIDDHFGFYYRLLSVHAHGSSMATTSQSNTRGRGVYNDAECGYLTLVLQLLNSYLSKSLLSQVELLSLQKKCSNSVDFANTTLSRGKTTSE